MNNEPNRKQVRVPLKHDLEVLHRRYYAFLYRKARAITGDHEDAEYAVHNVYLGFLEGNLPPADFARNPRAWFVRAVRHEAHLIVEAKLHAEVAALELG